MVGMAGAGQLFEQGDHGSQELGRLGGGSGFLPGRMAGLGRDQGEAGPPAELPEGGGGQGAGERGGRGAGEQAEVSVGRGQEAEAAGGIAIARMAAVEGNEQAEAAALEGGV